MGNEWFWGDFFPTTAITLTMRPSLGKLREVRWEMNDSHQSSVQRLSSTWQNVRHLENSLDVGWNANNFHQSSVERLLSPWTNVLHLENSPDVRWVMNDSEEFVPTTVITLAKSSSLRNFRNDRWDTNDSDHNSVQGLRSPWPNVLH